MGIQVFGRWRFEGVALRGFGQGGICMYVQIRVYIYIYTSI